MTSTEGMFNETELIGKKILKLLQLSSLKNVFLWRVDGFSEILRKAKKGGKQRTESDSY